MRAQGTLDPFGAILTTLSKRLGLDTHLFEMRLQHRWRDIVGEPMALHTWPHHLRFKKLSVLVRNSVWLQQLTFLKPALLAKLNEQAGAPLITDITFRVGDIPLGMSHDSSVVHGTDPTLPSASMILEASMHTQTVSDPELRDHLTRVIAAALSRRTS